MIRLALRVEREHAELVLAELLELAPAGVEEIDLAGTGLRQSRHDWEAAGQDRHQGEQDGGAEVVEYAVYGAPGELPDLPDLQAAAGSALVEVSTTEVPDDWSERWKQFHKPVLIGASTPGMPSLYVRPPWEAPTAGSDACEIVIDPAQAFGTGAHATTRLCLELLLELAAADRARGGVLDVGAGSGVLAIAAAKLGYSPVLALDNDRESLTAIEANAAVNGVSVDGRHYDLRRQTLPLEDAVGRSTVHVGDAPVGDGAERPAGEPVVLANLLRPLLLDLAMTMERPPAHLIASGLLRAEADEIGRAFEERLRMRERERREQGEWAALWLVPG